MVAVSCDKSGNKNSGEKQVSRMDESLINANKEALSTEDEQINDLAARYNWKMTTTGTGLRYLIYQKGNGNQVKARQQVSIRYELKLLTGETIASSAVSGIKTFTLGTGAVENGLEEALQLMNRGDKAKIIIPSHLAYGLTGDEDRIPPKATLVYDVELLIQKPNTNTQ